MAAVAGAPGLHTSLHTTAGHQDTITSASMMPSSHTILEEDQVDPMDVSPSSKVSMGPPNGSASSNKQAMNTNNPTTAAGSAAATQQPKVVQTAFIHKLYNMLEDQSIKHLISWSPSNESFLISPSTDFSKVLATYFKHTNISSFVRQLNMYGFHKVSDVFHSGSPDTPLWEFKHGNGSFKRGDLNGLREIKRRSSKHTIIHKDSVSGPPKPVPPMPVAPHEQNMNTTEARLSMLEQSLYDLHTRLSMSEESNAFMNAKCQDLTERLVISYQHNHDISGVLSKIVEDPNNPVHREATSMQRDIGEQLAKIRSDSASSNERYPPVARAYETGPPTSPHGMQFDDRRRASIQTLPRPNAYRPLAPSSNRNNSLSTAGSSPGSVRGLAPPAPPSLQTHIPTSQHHNTETPTIAIQPPPYIPRRHTSADVLSHDWPSGQEPQSGTSPFSGFPQTQTPTNLESLPPFGADQQIREKLASYSFGSNNNAAGNFGASGGNLSRHSSRGPSPPTALAPPSENGWTMPPTARLPLKDTIRPPGGFSSQNSSGPPTRRTSMANIQNMLNPVDTAETEEEEPPAMEGEEARKRKRVG